MVPQQPAALPALRRDRGQVDRFLYPVSAHVIGAGHDNQAMKIAAE